MTTRLPGACSPPAPGTPAAGTPRPAAGQAPPAGDREESPAGGSRGTVLDAAVRLALADAIAYREGHGECARCEPGAPCPDGRGDEALARQYRQLLEGTWA